MKKSVYLLGAALGAVLTLGSCGHGVSAEGADTLVSVGTSDSISEYYGAMAGGYINGELISYAKYSGQGYDHAEFMKGVQSVIAGKHSDAYVAGISTGLRINQDMQEMERQGVQINRDKLMAALKSAIMSDTVDEAATRKAGEAYQNLMHALQARIMAREEMRKAQGNEAVENQEAAANYMKEQTAQDPEIKKTDSGLYYRIERAGNGATAKANDRVNINYVGKHIDGSVFDQGNAVTMSPAGTVPGFQEALMMMAPGAKGTFYIPGELAYGASGQPQAGIGPMEMLVFEVEVLDINGDTAADAEAAK